MKSIVLIIPYFGKFPNYFTAWLNSCKNNETIDFMIFTDQDLSSFDVPANVIVNKTTLNEIKKLYKEKLGFDIPLNRPYKLCDLKPSYGEAFSSYIKKYDYWGHCDIDLVFGDIRKFITDDVLEKHDRIYSQGFLSLYRNNDVVNVYYRTLHSDGRLDWQKVFKSQRNWCFDEWAGHLGGGLSQIMADNNISMFNNVDESDVHPEKGIFTGPKIINDSYFEYDNGKLYNICKDNKREIILVHFQKRKIIIDKNIDYNHFYFIDPCYFTSDKSVLLKNRIPERMKHVCLFWFNTVKNKIKRDYLGI